MNPLVVVFASVGSQDGLAGLRVELCFASGSGLPVLKVISFLVVIG